MLMPSIELVRSTSEAVVRCQHPTDGSRKTYPKESCEPEIVTYFVHGLEVQVAELNDIFGLISEHFTRKVMQDVMEVLWNRVLLQILACHFQF